MKLSETRKDRLKILAAVVIGATLVVYVCSVAVINPTVKLKKSRAARIAELDGKLAKARKAVEHMARDRVANSNVVNEIVETAIRQNMVLRDRLGNFQVAAAEILDSQAKKVGIPISPAREIAISQIPRSSASKSLPVFQAYTVSSTFECGMHDLIRLLSQIETNNSYACISSLAIAAQPEKPEKHSIALEIQWPTWTDPAMPVKIEDQMKKVAESGGEPPRHLPAPPAGNIGSSAK
jgi:hypothetical protein